MIVLADVIKKSHLIDQVDLYTNKKGNLITRFPNL